MNLGDLNKVWEIKTLKRKPKEEEAKKILEKIAKQVQPLMRKHNWRVKLLSEFCPKNSSLLGLNVGAGVHVKLRLRRPNRDEEFLTFHEVLDTMLHELCHNVHSPHNSSFYKLWDEIRKECEDLISKGISGTGEGFDLPGKRVGGSCPQPPLSSLRKAALAAAEKREKLKNLLPAGPVRLGGDSGFMRALSPREAAAMAAERRLHDNTWCGSESCDIGDNENTDPADKGESSGQVLKESSGQVPKEMSRKRTLSEMQKSESSSMWDCSKCTLLNPSLAPICELCSTQKPKDVGCTWSCKFCTLDNSVSLETCSACNQWRYSYGPPVATLTTNFTT